MNPKQLQHYDICGCSAVLLKVTAPKPLPSWSTGWVIVGNSGRRDQFIIWEVCPSGLAGELIAGG